MNIFGMSRSGGGDVFLNVYDLHENNDILYPLGFGAYHSGVQVGRYEYTFAAGSGIYNHEPKQVPAGVKLRESVPMGNFKGTTTDLEKIISELRNSFGGSDYHVLNKNCNAFADAFLQRIVGKPSPAYVNRMAFYGSFFSCFLPDSLNQDPTQQQQQGGVSSSSSGSVYRSGSSNSSNRGTSTANPVFSNSKSTGYRLGGAADGGGNSNNDSSSSASNSSRAAPTAEVSVADIF